MVESQRRYEMFVFDVKAALAIGHDQLALVLVLLVHELLVLVAAAVRAIRTVGLVGRLGGRLCLADCGVVLIGRISSNL